MTHATNEKYFLTGEASAVTALDQSAFEAEVEADWFTPTIERKTLKSLMRRNDARGYRHFGIWLVLLAGSAVGVIVTWLSWWSAPFLIVYGVMYSMSDHHAHELSHGTPFKNRRVNEVFYQVNSFMALHDPVYWRWSHTRHHTHTLMVGRDPEIAVQRPPSWSKLLLDFFFIRSGWALLKAIFINAGGTVRGDGEHFIPESERTKVVRMSRLFVLLIVAVPVLAVATGSWLPVVLMVTPRFWGGFLAQVFSITQHAGMEENVSDHRLSTRTVMFNPLFRFLYINMNYHVEHHMFPMVPFHALPKLHEQIKDQCLPPSPSVVAAWREFIPVMIKHGTDETYSVSRVLP